MVEVKNGKKIMYNYLRFDENNGKSKVTLDKYGKK